MKKTLFVASLTAALLSIATIAMTKNSEHEIDKYKTFASAFSDSTAYAVITLDGNPVLLVSHETYINEDVEGNLVLNAIAAQLYGLDNKGKIVCYGEVRSQGTLYPLAVSKGTIMTAGHHFVNRYALTGSPLSLNVTEDCDITYSDKGMPTYFYENRTTGQCGNVKNDKHYNAMMYELEKAAPITFTKDLASK